MASASWLGCCGILVKLYSFITRSRVRLFNIEHGACACMPSNECAARTCVPTYWQGLMTVVETLVFFVSSHDPSLHFLVVTLSTVDGEDVWLLKNDFASVGIACCCTPHVVFAGS